MSFEQTLARLEQIASSLDRDDLPLEEALRLFEEGIAKLREANAALGEAEGKVQRLIEGASGVFALEEES
ncbi:MAG: exodeoxyribonuclease VII small subunit [Gemmatimonadota bacterium]|jgi:exodeoxyribonuclease VII small subunit|nr:exodeoxyribonuclease VII small subunit [Gemmatimonadota bacterium]MDQ8150130.1 exodeoxyribonuclease VII small subunit [Gemmatimonadota bacterium]MDQ8151691.1 exodeoxyribonuclease VII small subunit [Gemmatimonadota bacterium]MDQ8170303.1 exodeoxyribonuclease VII small subunit [Gemmatimonadota bacterium]